MSLVSIACAGDLDAGGASTSGNSPTYAPHSNPTTPCQGSQEVAPPPVWEPKLAAGQYVHLLRCEVYVLGCQDINSSSVQAPVYILSTVS